MTSSPNAFLYSSLLLLATGIAEAQSWLETQIEIEELARAGDFPAAIALSDTLIDEVRDSFGEQSMELADAHLFLATVYGDRQEFLAAEGHVLDAIDIVEGANGPHSTQLIPPYLVLGNTYHDSGEFELALSAYQEARDISRRNFGLLNEGQVDILERMSYTALTMGDFDEAKALQQEATDVVQRYYGQESREAIDASYRLADWYRSLRQFGEAGVIYLDVQRAISDDFDEDPGLTIELLRRQAVNQRDFARSPRVPGGASGVFVPGLNSRLPTALERALELAESLEPPDPLLQATILRDIGDWNVVYARYDEIEEPYLTAWNMLGSIEEGDVLRRAWFSDQTVVYSAPLYSPALVTDPAAPWGRVDVGFTIDPYGRASNVEILGANPAGLLEEAASRQVRSSLFRPQIVAGRIVAADGTYSWRFQYDTRVFRELNQIRPGPD